MSTSLRLILELQSKTTLLEQSSTKTGPLEAATLDHRSAGPNGYEVGFGIEDSGSLHGNVSERVLSRPYSLFSFSWCTFQDTPWRFCSPRVSPCCVSTNTSTLLELFYSAGVQSIFVGVIYPSLFAWVCTVLSDRLGCVADLNTPPEDLFEIPDIPSRMIGIEVAEKRAVLHLPGICNDPDVT